MAKKKQSWFVSEPNPFVDGGRDWMDLPDDGQTAIDIMDELFPVMEALELDAKACQVIWPDGQRLSIDESVQRIHADHPTFPADKIEDHIIFWIEMDYAPEHYSPKQLDELDRSTEKWIAAHNRRR
jgi:hypothetical protein